MADQQKQKIFTRDATGLVKSVSLIDSIALNISNMSAGAALGVIGFTMIDLSAGQLSGVNLAIGAVIAFLLSVPQIVVYTIMTQRLPRTGGDYVWVSRNLGGFFGAPLAFMGYTMETLAFLALITLSLVTAIGSVGLFFNPTSTTYYNWAVIGTAPAPEFELGAAIFTILILINIFRPKFGYKLVSGLTIYAVIFTVVAIGALLYYGNAGVQNYMNNVVAGGNASSPLTYSAVKGSYTGSSFDFTNTLFLLPFFAIFVFPWLNAAPAVASEIKGKSSVKWNVPLSAIIVFVLIASAFAAMYYVGGIAFTDAALNNFTLVTQFSFNFWTLAMGVTGNNALAFLIGLGWIVWNLAILAYGIIVFSRYLFAQAFDRFLPSRFAYVSEKYGSPAIAHVIDLVITLGLVAVAAFAYGSFQALFAAVIAAMIYFFFVGVSSVVYGTRKETGNTKLTLQIAGGLMALVFLFIIYLFLQDPAVWGTFVTIHGVPGYYYAYLYGAVSFIAGLVIFAASRAYHKSKGVDIMLAYKEIPPE